MKAEGLHLGNLCLTKVTLLDNEVLDESDYILRVSLRNDGVARAVHRPVFRLAPNCSS